MPIYAYKCDACGHAKDVLQKMSDAALTDCPACGAPKFNKQLTAPGFQLKGTGWYATDFKGGGATGAAASTAAVADAAPASSDVGSSGATIRDVFSAITPPTVMLRSSIIRAA